MKKRWLGVLSAALLLVQLLAVCAPASAEGDELVLSNCDAVTNWSASVNGDDALLLDTENKTEGEASVGAHAINGKLNQIQLVLEEPLDISGYKYLEFDVYYSDMTWFNDCGGVMFEITSSGKCDMQSDRWQKGVLRNQFEQNYIDGKDNWWHIKFNLTEPQSKANGGCNLTQFNFFRFYSVDPISTTPDYDFRIDNVKFTNNEDPEPTEPTDSTDTTAQQTNPTDNNTTGTTQTTENTGDTTTTQATQSTGSTTATTGGDATTTTANGTPAGPSDSTDSQSPVIWIVLAAVVVLGGGFAAYWFLLRKKK